MADPRRIVVFVHGICRHTPGYSDPWFAALKPHLPAGYEHAEVLWSDVVEGVLPEEPHSPVIRGVVEDRARRQAVEAAMSPVTAQYRVFGTRPAPISPAIPEQFGIPGVGCFKDCGVYLTDRAKRMECRKRFVEVVWPLLNAGVEVSVVSHSWGTVVAYEAMANDVGLALAVKAWFTVGAALSIGYVKDLLDVGHFLPVSRWVNVNAHWDVVGGSLSGMYPVDAEYLGLLPVGCSAMIPDPKCCHDSYFRIENAAVNRDVFAAEILR